MRTNLRTTDVKVLQLAEAGQGLLKLIGIDLVSDILDITEDSLLFSGARLSLLVVRTGGLPAGTVVRGAVLGAGLGHGSRGGSRLDRRLDSGGSRLRGGDRDGGDYGSRGTRLGGDVGPGLGERGGGSGLFLGGVLLLLGSRGRLRGWDPFAPHQLGVDSGDWGLGFRFLLGGSTVGLGSRLRLLSLAIDLLLQLLINLGGTGLIIHLSISSRDGLRGLRGLGSLGSLGSRHGGLLHELLFLVREVTKDVIEHIVSVGLLSENEGLDKLAGGLGLVGNFANDRDQNVIEGSLRVDIQNADLAVLEVELLDLVVDGLKSQAMMRIGHRTNQSTVGKTNLVANGDRDRLSLGTEDKLRPLGVEEVQLVGVAAHSSVILLDEEPANLILANLILLRFGRGGGGRSGGLDGLKVGRGIHGRVSMVERVRVPVRVVAVDRSLGHVGHVELNGWAS